MQAFIFAAGFGKRLAPLTLTLPKPLVPVLGKPLIQYHIERLREAGVSDFVINTHYLADKLTDYLGNGEALGVRIRWSHESDILDTGGGLANALTLLGEQEPFIVINGDIWTDYPFSRLVGRPLNQADAHLVMVSNPNQHPEGDFSLSSSGQLRSDCSQGARLTYAGLGLFHARLFHRWQKGADNKSHAFPLAPLLRDAMDQDRITGEHYQGDWEDVGTLERLRALEGRL